MKACEEAQNAIDSLSGKGKSDKQVLAEKAWLQAILNLLLSKKYVTIQNKDGVKFDVSAISETSLFLSFFDVCNHINWYNTDISPKPTEKLKNDFHHWYLFNVLKPLYRF